MPNGRREISEQAKQYGKRAAALIGWGVVAVVAEGVENGDLRASEILDVLDVAVSNIGHVIASEVKKAAWVNPHLEAARPVTVSVSMSFFITKKMCPFSVHMNAVTFVH